MSVAGIACVHPEGFGWLQKGSRTFAGRRRERWENRPTERSGNVSRRTLRLLFVMHLHDRHGAHLTLHGTVKQAGQSAEKDLKAHRAEDISYSYCLRWVSRGPAGQIVRFSLRGVTSVFHPDFDSAPTVAFTGKPAPAVDRFVALKRDQNVGLAREETLKNNTQPKPGQKKTPTPKVGVF